MFFLLDYFMLIKRLEKAFLLKLSYIYITTQDMNYKSQQLKCKQTQNFMKILVFIKMK